jgi:hypothetical protein
MSLFRRLSILAVAIGIVASSATAAPLDRYLPAKSQWVVGVNVRSLLGSAAFKKYGGDKLKLKLSKDKEAQELQRVLGFDPYEDVNTVIAAGLGDDPLEFLLIVHGRFDLDRIQPILDMVSDGNPEALKIAVEKTVRFYEFKTPEQMEPAFAAFLDDDTLVISNKKEHIFHAIERSNDRKPTRLEKGLQALVDKADAKKTVWIAAQVPEKARQKIAENPQAAPFAQKIKYVAGYVTVADGLQTELQLQTTDLRSAGELRNTLETIRPFVSKALQDNKDIGSVAAPILDGIKITQLKNSLNFSSKVSASQVDRIVKRLQK